MSLRGPDTRVRLDATSPHGCHGVVRLWFTLAATNRSDTPLPRAGGVKHAGPRDTLLVFAP